ncbi:MAG: transglutaminase domain-containing protein [Betaproteobacteria bacterium]|nr:transglutaminase domain-containing protein [Betaproteobacteria bacterium]
MKRRDFLKSSAAVAAAALPWKALAAEGWRAYEITTRVEIAKPSGVSRAWIPVPSVDATSWQRAFGSSWSGNATRTELASDGKYGVSMLYAEWASGTANPVIEITSRFATQDRAADLGSAGDSRLELSAADRAFFTSPTELIRTDGIVKKTALDITKGAKGDVEKARAIYEWIVDNTFRDPKVRGCGLGDITTMLETGNLGGKCADLNALFVGLCRSIGIPARDIYGIRVAKSQYGYKSLGAGSENVTKAQHCRADFFARGHGWVPVDPADVRKVVLEEPPGQLPVGDAKVVAARKRLFGSWEMNWLAYNMGHDVALPASKGPKIPFLMYVNAETDGQRLDQLDPDSMTYAITAWDIKV